MSDILNGKIRRLPDWDVISRLIDACLKHAGEKHRTVPQELGSKDHWKRGYDDLESDLAAGIPPGPRCEAPPGRLLREVRNPFELEVHLAVQADAPPAGLPVLPMYVQREHDQELADVVRRAAAGENGIAVLVGGSSTGKTRACWQALELLRGQPQEWRLWHPIAPSRPEAALRELLSIEPRTVVWLNEAQFYLGKDAGEAAERVAAGLRELLRDPARAPVVVLATLWPQYWRDLARRPAAADPHAQARELLSGHDIHVPDAFTQDQVGKLATSADPRLVQAAIAAEDRQVIQFLAGAPELLALYRNAPPAAAALISAAIDARRMGMSAALPRAFLHAAAPGYLTGSQWAALGRDWEYQAGMALEDTANDCKGICGPLTPVIPRPGDIPAPEDTYQLAEYLEQHGRRTRRRCIPPDHFWKAAACYADLRDLPALAAAAAGRGLLRHAAGLRKHATRHGSTSAAAVVVRDLHALHPSPPDPRPAQWAADHASLDNPETVAVLLDALREAGAGEQVTALASRDPAGHTSLDSPYGVAQLLHALHRVEADQQVTALASRVAGHAPFDSPYAADRLLHALHRVGADQQVTDLASRAAVHASLDNPETVAVLLHALQRAGADQQVTVLTSRDPAGHASLDSPGDVAQLLHALHQVGADQQVTALASRAAAHASLDSPYDITVLLDALRKAGKGDQAGTLVERLAAEGQFHLFRQQTGHQGQYQFGREPDGSPASSWGWEQLDDHAPRQGGVRHSG